MQHDSEITTALKLKQLHTFRRALTDSILVGTWGSTGESGAWDYEKRSSFKMSTTVIVDKHGNLGSETVVEPEWEAKHDDDDVGVHEDYTECERVRNLCLYPVHLSALVLVGEDDELADDASLKRVLGHDGEDETS